MTAVLTYVDERLAANPARMGKPLQGDHHGLHSARVGDYRLLFRLDDQERTAYVRRIDHRANAYRPA